MRTFLSSMRQGWHWLAFGLVSTLFPMCGVGCATVAPRELVMARQAYQHAAQSQAAELSPSQLHDASVALAHAEAAFRAGAVSQDTVDLAYIAVRRAELAEAQAQVVAAVNQRNKTAMDLRAAQAQNAADTRTALERTRDELQKAQQSAQTAEQRLAEEERARIAAEEKAKQTMLDLEKLANVKQEQRGVVLTLSGSVLFKTGKAILLPPAKAKLREVASVLAAGDQKMVIEGHTDSRGKATANQRLSEARANAVRTYLISQGVPSARIESVGMGDTAPVADNTSVEGRANNRRVEIVLPPAAAMPAAPGTPTLPRMKKTIPDTK